MTLKEKFSELLPFYNANDNNNKSIQCVKIADDYAIDFVLSLNDYYDKEGVKQILELFKEEKGL
jgi:hypothetical protein